MTHTNLNSKEIVMYQSFTRIRLTVNNPIPSIPRKIKDSCQYGEQIKI